MPPHRRITGFRRLVPPVVLCLLAACSVPEAVGTSVEQVMALQGAFEKELPGETIRLDVNTDHILSVMLVNSKVSALAEGARNARTRAVALFARRHYGRPADIEGVRVVLQSERSASVFQVWRSVSITYAASDLDAELNPPPAVTAGASLPVDTSRVRTGASTPAPKPTARWKSF